MPQFPGSWTAEPAVHKGLELLHSREHGRPEFRRFPSRVNSNRWVDPLSCSRPDNTCSGGGSVVLHIGLMHQLERVSRCGIVRSGEQQEPGKKRP